VFSVLFLILLLVCLPAPLTGRATSDARREEARPMTGWFPQLIVH
jgi:hypothetical protein